MESSHDSDHTFQVSEVRQQFLYPFLLKEGRIESLVAALLANDFTFFDVTDDSQEEAFYGKSQIFHRNLETYFMPNIEPILFPESYDARESIRRFSKALNQKCSFKSKHLEVEFMIDSIDVIICPFHIGLLNIRVSLPSGFTNNDVLHFADLFSYLVPTGDAEKQMKLRCELEEFDQVKDFISEELLQRFNNYIDDNAPTLKGYDGSLPFYKDERMYVISFTQLAEDREISKMDLYRLNQLNNYRGDGSVYLGATNADYIDRFYQEHSYDRWGPESYYLVTDHHFTCVTKEEGKVSEAIMRQMYSEHFYTLLLIFYFKLVLLKLSYEYSRTEFEKDHQEIEILTMMINEFSSKYYLPEFTSKQTGKEMSALMQENFENEKLYEKVKSTLTTLFQDEEKIKSKKFNSLLQILTFYTVISGIYGMNLVIEDLGGNVDWSSFVDFSLFEWISVFVTATGILLSGFMVYFFIKRWRDESKDHSDKLY